MDFKSFKLIDFEIGKGNKKYNAVLKEKKTGKIKKIGFGDKSYPQYEDKALKMYSHLNHYDEKRRNNYGQARAPHVGVALSVVLDIKTIN